MTMEFTTVEKTLAVPTYAATNMILRIVSYQGGLLHYLSLVHVPVAEPFTYKQVQRTNEIVSVTTGLFQPTNKFAIQPEIEISEQVLPQVMDLARTVNSGCAGAVLGATHAGVLDASDPVNVGAYSNDVLDMLIERLGKFWNPDECVFVIEQNLIAEPGFPCIVDVEKLKYRGAEVISIHCDSTPGQIALVSLNPEHGLFGIAHGKITNCLYKDARVGDPAMDQHGPVLGWRVEVGIKEKANPSRPEEVKIADADGMFKCGQVSWTGAFGIRNLNAIARAKVVPAQSLFPPKTLAESVTVSETKDGFAVEIANVDLDRHIHETGTPVTLAGVEFMHRP